MISNSQLKKRSRKGVTCVEFAMVLPLFLLFVFGLIEIVGLFRVQDSLMLAAFAGGREATIQTSSPDDVRDEIQNTLNTVAIRGATVVIEPATFDDSTSSVEIEITIPAVAENGFFLVGRIFSGSLRRNIVVER